jgi:tRNA threonylcarbamoyladenosine biosynthesis protein TsaB
MALLLLIETSSKNCSVALSENFQVIHCIEESSDEYVHAEKLHRFINELLITCGKQATDIDAVAVSKGPGSYTGLRIGVSTAKGFCYALDKPLIGIDTTLILAWYGVNTFTKAPYVRPMIDARRMEVYCALYDKDLALLEPVSAQILDEEFITRDEQRGVIYIGDGAEKASAFSRLVPEEQRIQPGARMMADLAFRRFRQDQFEDLAYFEPFYLKDFIPGIAGKTIL